MLPEQHPHPSHPSVFAISQQGDLMISSSSAPPTVYCQGQALLESPLVKIEPTELLSPVTCIAFCPTNTGGTSSITFVLGFRDGSISLYRVRRQIFRQEARHTLEAHHHQVLPTRVATVPKLHKATMGGVSAAAFIPGYKSRVISVGHDARCRMVDFKDGGKIIRT